jgi:hypothetical protein
MIPETSQTASADARASSPALEEPNTRCTVWSMPPNVREDLGLDLRADRVLPQTTFVGGAEEAQ